MNRMDHNSDDQQRVNEDSERNSYGSASYASIPFHPHLHHHHHHHHHHEYRHHHLHLVLINQHYNVHHPKINLDQRSLG